MIYLYVILVTLLIVAIIKIFFQRSFVTKHKYVRLVTYNDDMSIKVKYIKRESFNQDGSIIINPNHIFNFNGYTSIITTSNACESITPLDFKSQYDTKKFKTAIRSKLISETYNTLKPERFDKMSLLLLISGIELLAIIYLIYNIIGTV